MDRMEAHWAKVASWSKPKQRAYLIKLGAMPPRGQTARLSHGPCANGAEGAIGSNYNQEAITNEGGLTPDKRRE